MKLVDLVKRVEAAGLEARLSVTKSGNLHFSCWTNPPADGRDRYRNSLFGCMLDAGSHDTAHGWPTEYIIESLAKAAKHPHAIYRRELNAQFAKEDAEEAAALARSSNAA
jgi:hypothetical protein